MKPKFKQGDRVVILPSAHYFDEEISHARQAVIGGSYILGISFEDDHGKRWYKLEGTHNNCCEKDLELESVVNSPLYKALS